MGKNIAMAFLAVLLLSASMPSEEWERSPPYTVMVALSYESPFVPDGRDTFAEFAFSVTFKDVVFYYRLSGEKHQVPMAAWDIRWEEVKGTLTRHTLNKVETGRGAVFPKITKEPQEGFEAWLGNPPGPFREEWLKEDEFLLVTHPMPLQFRTSWGRDMMAWDYEVGHSYLEEIGFEMVIVDWNDLWFGRPVTLEFPYVGAFAEDRGSWWIEFIPQKKTSLSSPTL